MGKQIETALNLPGLPGTWGYFSQATDFRRDYTTIGNQTAGKPVDGLFWILPGRVEAEMEVNSYCK